MALNSQQLDKPSREEVQRMGLDPSPDAINVTGQLPEDDAFMRRKMVQSANEAIAKDAVMNPYATQFPPAPAPMMEQAAPVAETQTEQTQEEPEQEREPASQYTPISGMEILAGATPLLVDFLMGGNAGTDISAQYFIDKGKPREKDKNSLALQIEREKLKREQEKTKRAMLPAAPGSDKLLKANEVGRYMMPDGKVRNVTHSEALKMNLKPVDPQVGIYQNTQGVDKALDRDLKRELALKKLKVEGTKQQKSAFEKFSAPTSKYNQAEKEVWTIRNAMDVLNEGGTIGEGGIPSLVARAIFKEVGNLSQSDLRLSGGDPSALAIANRFKGKVLEGKNLTEEDRRDLKVLFDAAYKHSAYKARRVAETTKKSYRAMGTNIDDIVDSYIDLPDMPDLQPAVPPTRELKEQQSARRPAPSRATGKPGAPVSNNVSVTRISDGMTLLLPRAEAETLDKKKYRIGK
jgi:hypothetical protein